MGLTYNRYLLSQPAQIAHYLYTYKRSPMYVINSIWYPQSQLYPPIESKIRTVIFDHDVMMSFTKQRFRKVHIGLLELFRVEAWA